MEWVDRNYISYQASALFRGQQVANMAITLDLLERHHLLRRSSHPPRHGLPKASLSSTMSSTTRHQCPTRWSGPSQVHKDTFRTRSFPLRPCHEDKSCGVKALYTHSAVSKHHRENRPILQPSNAARFTQTIGIVTALLVLAQRMPSELCSSL